MTNSISGYRLEITDVRRTQRVFTNIGVFNNNKKGARNLRTNLNASTEGSEK